MSFGSPELDMGKRCGGPRRLSEAHGYADSERPILRDTMNTELSRRQILQMSALALAAFSPVGKALGAAGTGASAIDAGSLADYGKDGVFDQFASRGFFVIRKEGRIVAQSSICTHRRGRLMPTSDGFLCKTHNSAFAMDGKVTRPPAKADLVRHAVHIDDKNHLIVDTSKRIEHAQFDAPGAYVEVSPA
jgi:nitrite reductase/ring-hydroxylating ferredoxin subunit